MAAEPTDPPHRLTSRELEVLTGMTLGASNPTIASWLHTSPRTVSTHVERILAKLGCGSRTGAAALAVREGLIAVNAGSSDADLHALFSGQVDGPLAALMSQMEPRPADRSTVLR